MKQKKTNKTAQMQAVSASFDDIISLSVSGITTGKTKAKSALKTTNKGNKKRK